MAAPRVALSRSEVVPPLRALAAMPVWLTDAVDPGTVAAGLAAAVPELATLTADEVKSDRLRLKAVGWLGVYEVAGLELAGTLVPPWTGPDEVTGDVGNPDWACALPALGLRLRTRPPDAELPAVAVLTDPERAAPLLEQAIRAGSPAYRDLRIATCTPRVARHKAGSRTTVVYDLTYADEDAGRGWPTLVVAKTYQGGKGVNAYASMRALWDSPFRTAGLVAIAEPLAYLEDDRVLVQGPVSEQRTLKALMDRALRAPDAETLGLIATTLAKTGEALAAMHGSGVGYGKTVTLADEHAEVTELTERIGRFVPAVGVAAGPLLAAVAERASGPADPVAPCHRSFRPAQVLLAGGGISFIDFDGFCQAEPALDLALFRSTIRSITADTLDPSDRTAVRDERFALADRWCDLFTQAYEAHTPVTPDRVVLWETLDLLTSALHAWTKIMPERLGGLLFALEAHLERALD